MKRQARNIFWGVLFLLGAVALVAGRLGYLGGIGVWNILVTLCLAALLADGLLRRRFGEILFAAAFLIITYDKQLGLESITPWPVLGAALLGTVGLKLLFPGFEKKGGHGWVTINGHRYDGKKPVSEERRDGGSVSYKNVFGESVKYVTGKIGHVSAENAFGSLHLYFTDAALQNGSASVDVENSFGKTTLYVPADWRVELSTETAFGSVKEKGRCNPQGATVLSIRGETSFGSVEVRYV